MEQLTRKETNAIPKVGERYWYIFSSMVNHCFELKETQCYGYESDFLRMAKGNCFTVKKDAEEVLEQMNNYLQEIRETFVGRKVDEAAETMTDTLK